MIRTPDRGHQALGRDAAQHRNRQLRPDAGDGQQLLEQPLLLRLGEPEERNLILAHMGVDVQRGLVPFPGQAEKVVTEIANS